MITDNELVELANKVDRLTSDLMVEYKISPLILGSIILARLMVLTEMTKENEDFRKIMQSALDTKPFTDRILQ
jgi:hypothetical protein